jgi:glycosyltransferase involved in cell wall biosynthesis
VNVSIIIPVYNEEESLPMLHQSIHEALDHQPVGWEVIYIDDGSRDSSPDVMQRLVDADPERARAIFLRRNFGQTAAIAAGIDYSNGDVIVLMDADLQNDPADIPMMLDKICEGYEVVSGWRVNRQDKMIKRKLPSVIANGLISKVTGVHLHDYGCTLKAYRREVITGFRLYGEMHRFIPAYANQVGAKMIEVPVHHHARQYGTTKYGLNRTFKVILDLVTVKFLMSYAHKPIYLFGGAGIAMIALSFLVALGMVLLKIFAGQDMTGSPLLMMAVMLFILGFQSILMGLIAELLARTYHESQQKTTYNVRRVAGFPMEEHD